MNLYIILHKYPPYQYNTIYKASSTEVIDTIHTPEKKRKT